MHNYNKYAVKIREIARGTGLGKNGIRYVKKYCYCNDAKQCGIV